MYNINHNSIHNSPLGTYPEHGYTIINQRKATITMITFHVVKYSLYNT